MPIEMDSIKTPESMLSHILGSCVKSTQGFTVARAFPSSKFIDLVYKTDKEIWIVEDKDPWLNFEAVGQVLSYRILYEEQEKPTKPVKCAIACRKILPSEQAIRHCCDQLGIQVVETESQVG